MRLSRKLIAGVGVALVALWPHAGAQNGKAKAPAKKAAPAPATPTPLAVPFRTGEQLNYRVSWGPADAATAQLTTVGQEQTLGHETWHFRAKASTIKAVRFLYPLDDQFDSYSDVYALASVRYDMRIREKSKTQDRVIRMNRLGEPPPPGGPSVRVPQGTRDPVGLLYALRVWDWEKAKETVFPLYDGSKLYEVRAKEVHTNGSVTVPAGPQRASRIELRIFERGKEVTNAHFWVWLSMDRKRTPVLIEAELPLGKLMVELVSN